MRRTVIVIVVLIAVALALSGAFSGTDDEPAAVDPGVDADALIAIDGEYQIWPYTSRSESIDGRTLPINVVFKGDPETVRESIVTDPRADWEEMNETEAEAEPDFVVDAVTDDWDDAQGSVRYTYFEHADGTGQWVDESYQLHDGTYLGARDHIRAYESPDGSFTAVQVHEEYYDWFRLRHTVTDIAAPAERIESEYIELDADVSREYHGIESGWSDGWLSVIELLVLLPIAGALLRRETRRELREAGTQLLTEAKRHDDAAILGVGLAALYLSVRTAGVALETTLPPVDPKLIAVPLYGVLAVGLPAIAVVVGRRCVPMAAFLGVIVGLGMGFLLDFAAMGVAIPVDLVVHRFAIACALGLAAAGSAAENRGVLLVGLVAWTIGLALPLLDVL